MELKIEDQLRLGKIDIDNLHNPKDFEQELDAYVAHIPSDMKPVVKVAVAKALMDTLYEIVSDHNRRRDHRERWWDYHYAVADYLGDKVSSIRRWLEDVCNPSEIEDPSLKAMPLHWRLKDKLIGAAHSVLLDAHHRTDRNTLFAHFDGGEIIIAWESGCTPKGGDSNFDMHMRPHEAANLARQHLEKHIARPVEEQAEMDERHADWQTRKQIMERLKAAGILQARILGPEECSEILQSAVERLTTPLEDDEPENVIQ